MNVDSYKIFLFVAKLGNITAAADRLGYTQSGVSHIIAQLENEFGFQLFIRSKTGVRLTQNAERILPLIRDIVKRDEQIHQVADEIKGIRSGRLRVGAFSSVATHWLPRMIKEFNKLYPNIEFDISIGTYLTIEELIFAEEVDFGFMTKHFNRKLDFLPLIDDRLLVLLPEDHPLAKLNALPIRYIAELDLIVPGEGSNYDIGHILSSAGIRPNVKFTVSDDYAAIAMVRNGLGITIVPELILSGISNVGRVMELNPPCSRTIGLASCPHVDRSPACRAFMDFVKNWTRRLQ